MSQNDCFVGIDVSKQTLQVCVLPHSVQRSFDNSPSGHLELLQFLGMHQSEGVLFQRWGLGRITGASAGPVEGVDSFAALRAESQSCGSSSERRAWGQPRDSLRRMSRRYSQGSRIPASWAEDRSVW